MVSVESNGEVSVASVDRTMHTPTSSTAWSFYPYISGISLAGPLLIRRVGSTKGHSILSLCKYGIILSLEIFEVFI